MSNLDLALSRWVPWQDNARDFLVVHLQTRLPYEKPLIKTNYRGNYTTIYVCLATESIEKLKDLAQNQEKTQSAVLREILDYYFQSIKKKGILYEPLRKFSPVGLKILPRTITKEQDVKLRELAEKSGRKVSELVRDAVDNFVESSFVSNN